MNKTRKQGSGRGQAKEAKSDPTTVFRFLPFDPLPLTRFKRLKKDSIIDKIHFYSIKYKRNSGRRETETGKRKKVADFDLTGRLTLFCPCCPSSFELCHFLDELHHLMP